MDDLQHHHLKARRMGGNLLRAVLIVVGAVLVAVVLAAEIRNPFAVLADQLNAAVQRRD